MNPIDDGQDSGQSFPEESSFRSYRKLESFVDKWATEGPDQNLFSPRVSVALPRLLKPSRRPCQMSPIRFHPLVSLYATSHF